MPRERYVPGGRSCSLQNSCSEGKDSNTDEMKELIHYGWKQKGKVIPKDAEKFGLLTTKSLRTER